jgi:hypothetical protein
LKRMRLVHGMLLLLLLLLLLILLLLLLLLLLVLLLMLLLLLLMLMLMLLLLMLLLLMLLLLHMHRMPLSHMPPHLHSLLHVHAGPKLRRAHAHRCLVEHASRSEIRVHTAAAAALVEHDAVCHAGADK